MANNTPRKNEKTLFYFIIDWIFFWQNTKKNIYYAVNHVGGPLVGFRCGPLSLDHRWPVLDDTFSSL